MKRICFLFIALCVLLARFGFCPFGKVRGAGRVPRNQEATRASYILRKKNCTKYSIVALPHTSLLLPLEIPQEK